MRALRRLAFLPALAPIGLAGGDDPEPLVVNPYENPSDAALGAVPVTFSQVGAAGDFQAGMVPILDGRALPAQVDVLRRHADGSIRHALVSFVLPEVAPRGELPIGYADGRPATPPAFAWSVEPRALRPRLVLTPAEGAPLVSDLFAILDRGPDDPRIAVLHDGPVMKEYEIHDVPVAGGEPSDEFDVYWRLRFFSGQTSARVACVVERTRLPLAGRRPVQFELESVKVSLGGKTAYWAGAHDHLWQTRYRILLWSDGQLEDIHRRPNYSYWVEGDFYPGYAWSKGQGKGPAGVDAKFSRGSPERPVDPRRGQGILETGLVYRHMPGTGDRWDIGPYPAWTTEYLLTGAPATYRRILHADGNGSAAFWIHCRQDGMAGWNVFDLDRSRLPLERANKIDAYALPDGSKMTLRPDHAHAPSLGYVSYLLTGDRFFAEETSFWASYQLGEWPHTGIDVAGSGRAQAWSLRHVVDAAWILPDRDPMREVARAGVEKYIADFEQTFVQTARPLHFVHSYYNGSGSLDWINCTRTAPWMQSWLVWSLHNAHVKGVEGAAACRDWVGDLLVGAYTSEDEYTAPDGVTYRYDPRDAMPYRLAVALWEHEVYTDEEGVRRVRIGEKLKDIDNYAEAWYWTKVNTDNEYPGATGLRGPAGPADGHWPLDTEGWGNGMFVYNGQHKPWWGWHRYAAWPGLCALVEGGAEGARDAWDVMRGLAGPSLEGYEMVPRAVAEPSRR